jgi:hypothetical protein
MESIKPITLNNCRCFHMRATEAEIHEAQLLTYLRLSHVRFGLLINFNVPVLKDGLKRLVNGFDSVPQCLCGKNRGCDRSVTPPVIQFRS